MNARIITLAKKVCIASILLELIRVAVTVDTNCLKVNVRISMSVISKQLVRLMLLVRTNPDLIHASAILAFEENRASTSMNVWKREFATKMRSVPTKMVVTIVSVLKVFMVMEKTV